MHPHACDLECIGKSNFMQTINIAESKDSMTQANSIDRIGDRREAAISRAPKRSKSMICLSSQPLDFSDVSPDNSPSPPQNSNNDNSNSKEIMKSSEPFKIPLPPRRRVSCFVSSGELKRDLHDKESSLNMRPSPILFSDRDRCFSDTINALDNVGFKRSRSFCDPRLNTSISDSWREML